jgi:hypothetical protein
VAWASPLLGGRRISNLKRNFLYDVLCLDHLLQCRELLTTGEARKAGDHSVSERGLQKKTLIALIFVCTVHFSLVEDHQIRRTLGRNCCLHTCSMPEVTLTLFFSSSGSIDPSFAQHQQKQMEEREHRKQASNIYTIQFIEVKSARKKQKAPWYKIFPPTDPPFHPRKTKE